MTRVKLLLCVIALLTVLGSYCGVFMLGKAYEGAVLGREAAEAAVAAARLQADALARYREMVDLQRQRELAERAALQGRLADYEKDLGDMDENGEPVLTRGDVERMQRLNGQK
jgi:hypothetical protein